MSQNRAQCVKWCLRNEVGENGGSSRNEGFFASLSNSPRAQYLKLRLEPSPACQHTADMGVCNSSSLFIVNILSDCYVFPSCLRFQLPRLINI